MAEEGSGSAGFVDEGFRRTAAEKVYHFAAGGEHGEELEHAEEVAAAGGGAAVAEGSE